MNAGLHSYELFDLVDQCVSRNEVQDTIHINLQIIELMNSKSLNSITDVKLTILMENSLFYKLFMYK